MPHIILDQKLAILQGNATEGFIPTFRANALSLHNQIESSTSEPDPAWEAALDSATAVLADGGTFTEGLVDVLNAHNTEIAGYLE